MNRHSLELSDADNPSGCDVGNLTLAELDSRIDLVERDFLGSDIWTLVVDRRTSTELIASLLREVYWEIHCYQPFTTEAGFRMIGRIEPTDHKLMRVLLLHKWEEVEHRVWALDGYLALGGDPNRMGNEKANTSPGAFAVAAVWQWLAQSLHPIAYLGAEYLFEAFTARVTRIVGDALASRNMPAAGLHFVTEHATEDARHAALLRTLITDAVNRHPKLHNELLLAFDCFRQVYPLPLWMGSLQRVLNPVVGPQAA